MEAVGDGKICADCFVEKPLSEFGMDSSKREGLSRICRKCAAGATRKYRQNLAERMAGIMPVELEDRVCSACKQHKPAAQFSLRKSLKAGRSVVTTRSECKDCERRRYFRKYSKSKKHKEYMKNWKLLKKFGISLEQYREIERSQKGMCAICGKTPNDDKRKSALVVDHDHRNGSVRGLLCRHCNIGIGKLGDTVQAIEKALVYLKKSPAIDRSDW